MATRSLKDPQVNSWFKWLIILFALSHVFSIYTYLINPVGLKALFPETPQWEYYLRGGISVLQLLLLYKIWKLSKVALYVYIATIMISYAIGIITGQTISVIIGAALLAVFYQKAIKPIWGDFK